MKYFSMRGEMNSDMLDKFIDFANGNQEEGWSIVLNTGGGGFFVTETICRMVNSHSKIVEVIVQGAYSSGFLFLNEICGKAKLVLSKTCRGMWHYGKWDLNYSDRNKPYYKEDECIIRNMPFHKKQTEALAKKVMTATELVAFKKDDDVYFDFARMKQLFPDAEIMK